MEKHTEERREFVRKKVKEIAEKMKRSPLQKKHRRSILENHKENMERSKKGRESLETPKDEHNEGEDMYLGKNEHNRP